MAVENEKKFITKANLLPGEEKMGERIALIRETFCKGRNIDFAQRLGKEPTYTSQICNGMKIPSKAILEEIITAFPEVSRPWLYFGEGKMLRSENFETEGGVAMKTLPLIPYEAVAGLPTTDNPGLAFADCKQYSVPDFLNRGADFLINVTGDSMEPTYFGGDMLACGIVREVLFFQWGKPYVLDTSQGVLVKRVMPGSDKEHITLVSDNKEKYPPFEVPTTDIRSLSLVVGLIRAV